jgi:hypothetical protein
VVEDDFAILVKEEKNGSEGGKKGVEVRGVLSFTHPNHSSEERKDILLESPYQ